jgi:macrolide transport system ATP-binding/permease protein
MFRLEVFTRRGQNRLRVRDSDRQTLPRHEELTTLPARDRGRMPGEHRDHTDRWSSMSQPSLLSPLAPLVARDVVKAYGDRVVLDGVDLIANPGEPLGLVGENGAGKSTLLRVLAGVVPSEGGTVTTPAELGYLQQEPSYPAGITVAGVLDEAMAPLHHAVRRLEELAARITEPGVAEEYDAVLTWAQAHDVWQADQRAAEAATRLGLDGIERERHVASLSGGQRTRLALAAMIAARPACVLLDEPTNHLDDDAVALLEEFLVELPGVVVVASHDRAFLDRVCAAVVDLDPSHFGVDGNGGSRFSGGYSAYLAAKRAARQRWQDAFEAQQEELNQLRDAAKTSARNVAHNRAPRDNDKYIYSFKGGNVARTVSRRVRDAERRIEVLERERIPKPPKEISFRGALTPAGRSNGLAVFVRDLEVAGRVRVPRVDVPSGTALLITGANGSGTSTLLKVLAGELTATSGQVSVSARRVGHLPQDVTFSRPDLTPQQVYDAATGRAAGERAPAMGELGLLHPRELARPVGVLSEGQRRRLALAVLVARRPDLLLLDEPTNHISLTLAEELEDALQRSVGTVVVASHDRWLRAGWEGEVLAL